MISVLLPYRDASATLPEALQSLLDDTAVPFELLAINDGSTDSGPAQVAALAARDPRVVPLSTSGVGIARALAHGLESARGSFIARMDGDDISLPGRLARSRDLLERDARLGVVGTQVEAFPDGAVGDGMRRYVDWLNTLITPEDHERDLFVESPLCHPSVMLRRSALEDAGGYRDTAWAEDYDLWLRLAARGHKLAKVPALLLRWRHRDDRATLRDPRYSLAQFDAAKAHYLAPRLARLAQPERPLAVWGAGKTGKRIARALARAGARAEAFIDIDPRKIGGVARGAPILEPAALTPGRFTVVVAVGARGARALIRAHLAAAGFTEGADYICAS